MTIDERLEAITVNLELISHSHEALARNHEALFLRQAEDHAKGERRNAKTESILRRAIAAGVEEARTQRERSRELDEKIATVTQQLLEAWRRRGENGKN